MIAVVNRLRVIRRLQTPSVGRVFDWHGSCRLPWSHHREGGVVSPASPMN
ncbi:hypothetical protein [Stieleria sp.]|uniref:Uncharacterized protein n=1 Tax=Stieleria magnilauensis TaxID=2527963 RepID=A0ABX5XW48_9BACT|nr:hypothetical protein TBK1r_49640 [Planctomycetes bacterium TBK1r]